MTSDVGSSIHQFWSWSMILLSYLISTTGSYCTIQLMENWRRVDGVVHKRVMLSLSALALGGCGIWCTHFTGMTALKLEFEDGTSLEMDFELGLTILSFIFAVLGVLIGLKIASMDPYFLEMEAARRKEMLRTNATMELNAGIVTLSVFIAFFTANAAFWILFRALTFMPDSELLRLGSALIMGVAVCATHYCGMGAASYKLSAENFSGSTRFIINRSEAAIVASHGALLTCYWLASFSVVRSVRIAEMSATATTIREGVSRHDKSKSRKNSNQRIHVG
ncbi:putative signaling protein [Phytophthora nicotianae]|uniref:Signaling protein n=1 Tax=Phytophthora nicotianae TaxID=4792 RepID=A0A0W8CEU6_PHYNI|nr:putative signaling protein [Phytophthora nicotianae]